MSTHEDATVVATSYSERLQTALTDAEKSIQDLADAMGISYQAVRKALKGDTGSFTAENNEKAAKALNVSAGWLATGLGRKQRGQAGNADADDVRSALQTIRSQLALGQGTQSELVANALGLLARVPDSDRVFEDALLALLALQSAAGDGVAAPAPIPVQAAGPSVKARAEALAQRLVELGAGAAQDRAYSTMLQALEAAQDETPNPTPPKARPRGGRTQKRARAG